MLPNKYNLTHYRGDAFKRTIRFLSAPATPIDLTGRTILAQVRESTELDAAELFSFVLTRDDPNGEVEISLLPATTKLVEAGKYAYDIQIDDTTYLYGDFDLVPDVSRAA